MVVINRLKVGMPKLAVIIPKLTVLTANLMVVTSRLKIAMPKLAVIILKAHGPHGEPNGGHQSVKDRDV